MEKVDPTNVTGEQMDKILKFDPLQFAEDITGVSYKEDDSVAGLGLGLQMMKSQAVKELLEANNDVRFTMGLDEYLAVVKDIGFEIVLEMPFEDPDHDNPRTEVLYILWHKRYSILLKFDTYFNQESVNGGNFYYNWLPNKDATKEQQRNCQSSGSWHKMPDGQYALVGSHDCREAARHHIYSMALYGRFLTQWVEQPFLWLLHFMDTKDEKYNYKKINEERMSRLPDYVRNALTPKKEVTMKIGQKVFCTDFSYAMAFNTKTQTSVEFNDLLKYTVEDLPLPVTVIAFGEFSYSVDMTGMPPEYLQEKSLEPNDVCVITEAREIFYTLERFLEERR